MRFSYSTKITSIVLSLCLTNLNSLSHAEAGSGLLAASAKQGALFSFPEQFGKVEESFIGTSGKTLIYIQDAHDSLEAQENIAKMILFAVENYGVSTVFEEGYEGPVPSDQYFGWMKDAGVKEKISHFLMDKLRLSGAEYAHINRNYDFKLIGADTIRLHRENVKAYKVNSRYQKQTDVDLRALIAEICKLIHLDFPKKAGEWIGHKIRFDEGTLPLPDYLKAMVALSGSAHYPAINLILRAERTGDREAAEQARSIEAKTLFEEIGQMENDLAKTQLTEEKDQALFRYHQILTLFQRLNAFQLTFPEYEAVEESLRSVNTEEITKFIFQLTQKPMVLSRKWERNIQNAIRFYQLARARDQAIEKRFDDFLHRSREKAALLVYGGFHKSRIVELLKAREISFHVMAPKITEQSIKHREYYKRLMSAGHHPFEVSFNVRHAAAAERLFEIIKPQEFPSYLNRLPGGLGALARFEMRSDKIPDVPGNPSNMEENPEIEELLIGPDEIQAFINIPEEERERIAHDSEHILYTEVDEYVTNILSQTREWIRTVEVLQKATNLHKRNALFIKGEEGDALVDLPVHVDRYKGAVFHAAKTLPSGTQGRIVKDITYGYTIGLKETRRIGPIRYAVLDDKGNVVEMGFHTEEVMQNFKEHFFGRKLSGRELRRIARLNRELMSFLRSDPDSRKEMDKFVDSRKWPKVAKLDDVAQLAYFHNRLTPLEQWAEEKHFTPKEMTDAGWFLLQFDSEGRPNYTANGSHVIRIPYFNPKGELEVWRTRDLRIKNQSSHKYTSWPLDRSIERKYEVWHALYNGWLLDRVRGKDLILTEGEFKCLVAWHLGKVPAVGIPGITQVNEDIIDAIIAAGPRRITIILDRDPLGKAWMRVDGISDSQRAAALIAKNFIDRGFPDRRIRIGILPNIFQGQKVGLDDFLLEKGPSSITGLLDHAVPFRRYLRMIKLDPLFLEIIQRFHALRTALRQYSNSAARGGPVLTQSMMTQAMNQFFALNRGFRVYLNKKFGGARRIAQPQHGNMALFASQWVPEEEHKVVLTSNNSLIPLLRFTQDIAQISFYTEDLPAGILFTLRSHKKLPYSMADLRDAFAGGRVPGVNRYYIRGLAVLYPGEQPEAFRASSLTHFAHIVLAGFLQSIFPEDEYHYEYGLTLAVVKPQYVEEITKVPLAIFKKDGVATAFIYLPVWPQDDKTLRSFASRNTNVQQGRAVQFFRQKAMNNQQDKFEDIVESIFPYYFHSRQNRTEEAVANLGLPPEIVSKHELVLFETEDWWELIEHLLNKRLLSQAEQSGLFLISEDTGEIIPRFENPVILVPIRANDGKIASLRVMPLEAAEHLSNRLPPEPKLVHHLYGIGRNYQEIFDPKRFLFLQKNLRGVAGKPLVITYHELDAMVLQEVYPHVVGLNSEVSLHEDSIIQIGNAQPSKIIVVVPPGVASKFDFFNFDGIPGFLKEIYELQRDFAELTGQRIPLDVFVSPAPLTHYVQDTLPVADVAARILNTATSLEDYLRQARFKPEIHAAVRHFINSSSRLIDYLQIPALTDPLDGRPIEGWVTRVRNLYKTIAQYAVSGNPRGFPAMEAYFQRVLDIDGPVTLSELTELRRQEDWQSIPLRELYRRSVEPSLTRKKDVWIDFAQYAAQVFMAAEGPLPHFNNLAALTSLRMPGLPAHEKEEGAPGDVSKLYELAAQNSERLQHLEFDYHATGEEFFSTVSVEIEGERISVTSKPAASKKLARANAAASLLKRIEQDVKAGEPEKSASVEQTAKITTKEFKGTPQDISTLYDFVAGHPAYFKNLAFTYEAAGDLFAATAAVEVKSEKISLTGKPAKSKQQAKANAAASLLNQLHSAVAEQDAEVSSVPLPVSLSGHEDDTGRPADISAVYDLMNQSAGQLRDVQLSFEASGDLFFATASIQAGEEKIVLTGKPAKNKPQAKANVFASLLKHLHQSLPEKKVAVREAEKIVISSHEEDEGTPDDISELYVSVSQNEEGTQNLNFIFHPDGQEFIAEGVLENDNEKIRLFGKPAATKKQAKANVAASLLRRIRAAIVHTGAPQGSPANLKGAAPKTIQTSSDPISALNQLILRFPVRLKFPGGFAIWKKGKRFTAKGTILIDGQRRMTEFGSSTKSFQHAKLIVAAALLGQLSQMTRTWRSESRETKRMRRQYVISMDMDVFDALLPDQRVEIYKLFAERPDVKFVFQMDGERQLTPVLADVMDFEKQFSNVEVRINPGLIHVNGLKVINVMKEGVRAFYAERLNKQLNKSPDYFPILYPSRETEAGLVTAALLLLEAGREDILRRTQNFSEIPADLKTKIQQIHFNYVYVGRSA